MALCKYGCECVVDDAIGSCEMCCEAACTEREARHAAVAAASEAEAWRAKAFAPAEVILERAEELLREADPLSPPPGLPADAPPKRRRRKS